MTRITAVNPNEATGKAKQLLDGVQRKLGITPNLMRTFANSSAVLEAYLNFSGALGEGLLDAKLRERIALTVAEANSCQYCLSAHTAIGRMVGLNGEDLTMARQAEASNAKTAAALRFAREIVVKRGEVSDADLQTVKNAGYGEGEIAEIIANVALNIFTNYFNHVAQTEVDFPPVALTKTA